MRKILVTGSFDNIHSRQVRFLEEASKLGDVQVLLYSDAFEQIFNGRPVRFPQAERQYFLESIRYVSGVSPVDGTLRDNKDAGRILAERVRAERADCWAISPDEAGNPITLDTDGGIEQILVPEAALQGFPTINLAAPTQHKKVLVSGCYDWLHSGHVRFFEEVSALGDLYVVVGNDENVRFLKGAGHPMFAQDERRYMVGAVRFVHQALVSTGWDWLDYAPQVEQVKPDMFAVNEDGDKPEKRQFCQEHGIEYVVLKRTPREGLPRRESTKLRGF